MSATAHPVFTIGHSNHSLDTFVGLLSKHGVDQVIDVRSSPYSRYAPHFNYDILDAGLCRSGIGYESLGGVLGGRPAELSCYDSDGRVQYDVVARMDSFDDGIRAVIHRAEESTLSLMCSEKDPLECHRTLLVARALVNRNISVQHILAEGHLESHDDAMRRLTDQFKLPHRGDMFRSPEDVISEAVARKAKKISHVVEKALTAHDPAGIF